MQNRLLKCADRPLRSQMRCHVEVHESTAVVLDDDKHVRHSERAGHRNEEITGDNRLRMIAKKGRPPLGKVTSNGEVRFRTLPGW